jgi:type III pantothenate kinase
MKLLIDLGNTRLKCALWDGSALRFVGALPHVGEDIQLDFNTLWNDIGAVSAILIASVASAAVGDEVARKAFERFGVQPGFVVSPASACGVRNAYAEPGRLGIDRFLGLVALHAAESGPSVLASCGTALTLDALAADGSHLGGLIAPSPPLMRDALTGATARLSTPQAARVVEHADNTGDAIESGVWLAGAALVERFVAHATKTFGTAPSIVLTGGSAARLATLLEPPCRVDAELVLRGLAIYAASSADARIGPDVT